MEAVSDATHSQRDSDAREADASPHPPTATASSSLFKKKSVNRSTARRTVPASTSIKSETDAGEADDAAERSDPLHCDPRVQPRGASATDHCVLCIHSEELEQTRLLQRFRATKHTAASAESPTLLLSLSSSSAQSASQAGGGATVRLIGSSFQAEVESKDLVEEQMTLFIEAEIEKRRREREVVKRPREDEAAEEARKAEEEASKAGAEDSVLKEVTALLRKKPVLDEREEASADRWLRGIAEVPLPIASEPNIATAPCRAQRGRPLTGTHVLLCAYAEVQSSLGECRADGGGAHPTAPTRKRAVSGRARTP